jgi:hypothetical protein
MNPQILLLNYNYFNHMKKKLFLGMAGLAFVTVSTVNANSSDSDLLSQNREALTRIELLYGEL